MHTYYSKLACGETAWFMHGNKAVSMPIGKVEITKAVTGNGEPLSFYVFYGFRILDNGIFKDWMKLPESECFATKEELLASL